MASEEMTPPPATRRRAGWLIAILFGIVMACLAAVIHARYGADRTSAKTAAASATPAAVAPVERADLSTTLELATEFRPFQEVNIYARAAGYVRQMKVDIGTRVEVGSVIAVLEIPELQDDVHRALAEVDRARQEVERARASFEDAHLGFGRLEQVSKQQPNLVAEQDVDQARARDEVAKASLDAARSAVRAAEANRAKYTTMAAYARILAPFSGVVTKRYADAGSLVGAGTSSSSQALVRLSQLDPLRLVLPVPESAVPRIHVGAPVQVTVQATGKILSATVARISGEVATDTRTMPVEVDVPNPSLTLAPGMYTTATMVLDTRRHVLSIPIDAAPDRDGGAADVYVLDDKHRIVKRRVAIGLETADRLEVADGLHENELVLLGGHGQHVPGDIVVPRIVAAQKVAQ